MSAHLALWCAITSALLSGFSNSFYTAGARELTPIYFSFLATSLAALGSFLILRISGRSLDLSQISDNKLLILRLIVARGFLSQALFSLATQYTSASKIVVLSKMEPYLVMLWAWLLFREKVARSEIVLLAIHIAGALLVSLGGDLDGLWYGTRGDLLIFAAILCSSYSYSDSKKGSLKFGAFGCSLIISSGAALIFGLILVLLRAPYVSNPIGGYSNLLASVLLFQLIGLPLWLVAVAQVKGWQVSAIRALSPLTGIPFAAYYLGESLDPKQLIGAGIVCATSALIGLTHIKGGREKPKAEV